MHGITLGFGVTLIGEAVDYAIYLFTQTAPGARRRPTILRDLADAAAGHADVGLRLQCHAAVELHGVRQLGLFTITGLAVALAVTRWVLPVLLPGRIRHDRAR